MINKEIQVKVSNKCAKIHVRFVIDHGCLEGHQTFVRDNQMSLLMSELFWGQALVFPL